MIVGAGPTGVELAGALAEIARQTLRNDFRAIRPEEAQILILDGSPRVLSAYPEDSWPKPNEVFYGSECE